MKKRFCSAVLSALLLIGAAGCGSSATPPAQEDKLNILATTYPVYLFATAVTEGVEGVEVSRLITEEVSCLHDYTLSVNDMKAIEKADVIILNGAGLEDFMSDALAASDAAVIDCSEGIELLPATGHHDHDHGEEAEGEHYDPHFWLDPNRASTMVDNIGNALSQLDDANGELYEKNSRFAVQHLDTYQDIFKDAFLNAPVSGGLITFHDGFQYFADAFGLTLLKAIEEEEGAEASAAEIKQIVTLIRDQQIPVIFTEVNGSDSTAQAIARETGVAVAELTMMMSGSTEGIDLDEYYHALAHNVMAVINGYYAEEKVILE